jgi:hypothetical protein
VVVKAKSGQYQFFPITDTLFLFPEPFQNVAVLKKDSQDLMHVRFSFTPSPVVIADSAFVRAEFFVATSRDWGLAFQAKFCFHELKLGGASGSRKPLRKKHRMIRK